MAYAFRFPDEVTILISSMRDWRLEDVKKKGGTSSRLGLVPFSISNHTAEFQPRELRPCTYWITVRTRYIHDRVWITCLIDNEFSGTIEHDWANGICKGNEEFEKRHGNHVYACPLSAWPPPEYEDDEYSDDSESDY